MQTWPSPLPPQTADNPLRRQRPYYTPESAGRHLTNGNYSGLIAYGYPATILSDLCCAVLDAKNAGVLMKRQEHMAERCNILARSLTHVSIIALVDEVTGYQDIRDKNALAQILKKLIAEESQPWIRTFPLEFYKEIYRLKGWDWPALAEGKKPPTPQVIGRITNDICV